MAAEYNFPAIIKTNTFKARTITILKNNVPLDLTGATVCLQLKKSTMRTAPSYTMAHTISNAAAGEITLSAWQVDLDTGNWNYDLKITLGDGSVLTYIKGIFPIHQNISSCL